MSLTSHLLLILRTSFYLLEFKYRTWFAFCFFQIKKIKPGRCTVAKIHTEVKYHWWTPTDIPQSDQIRVWVIWSELECRKENVLVAAGSVKVTKSSGLPCFLHERSQLELFSGQQTHMLRTKMGRKGGVKHNITRKSQYRTINGKTFVLREKKKRNRGMNKPWERPPGRWLLYAGLLPGKRWCPL